MDLINHDITYIVLPRNYEDNIFIISNDVLKEYIPDKIYAVIDDQIELIKSKYLFEDWIENNKLLDLESDNKYKHTYLDKIKTGNIKNPNNKLFVK